jgi:hypothetical protein
LEFVEFAKSSMNFVELRGVTVPRQLISVILATLMLTGCEMFHSYEGDVAYRSVVLNFRSDEVIDQLWEKCGGQNDVQAFAIRKEDGSCQIWMRPPKGEDDHQFTRILYHELGHCEAPAFGTTHSVEAECAVE